MTGDPDCKLRVKRSTNQEQPDGSTKVKKEYIWGYGSGVAAATTPDYGDVVLTEYTLPFNEGNVTYFEPLYLRTVNTLGFFPTHTTADAAYGTWYVYQKSALHGSIAAIPLCSKGLPSKRSQQTCSYALARLMLLRLDTFPHVFFSSRHHPLVFSLHIGFITALFSLFASTSST